MERLHGEPLGEAIARGRTLSRRSVAAFVASQVLSALRGAHASNVVHRDLKPDNVFLTAMSGLRDIVKLLDFGVAKLMNARVTRSSRRRAACSERPRTWRPSKRAAQASITEAISTRSAA
jgi:serine/threonine-protein kinase